VIPNSQVTNPKEGPDVEATQVSIVQLIANPERYDHKTTRLIGYFDLEFEEIRFVRRRVRKRESLQIWPIVRIEKDEIPPTRGGKVNLGNSCEVKATC
jgi:hypothetical protein